MGCFYKTLGSFSILLGCQWCLCISQPLTLVMKFIFWTGKSHQCHCDNFQVYKIRTRCLKTCHYYSLSVNCWFLIQKYFEGGIVSYFCISWKSFCNILGWRWRLSSPTCLWTQWGWEENQDYVRIAWTLWLGCREIEDWTSTFYYTIK